MAALGVSLYTFMGLSYRDCMDLGRLAEELGFDGVFVAEAFTDGLAAVEAMALATTRITIGTGITNIFLRHPAMLGAGAVAVDELSGGRLILGIGITNDRILKPLGISMPDPRAALRETTSLLRQVFAGQTLPGAGRAFRPAQHPIPIHFAGLALETAELAGEIADGLMLYIASKERHQAVVACMQGAARRAGRNPQDIQVTLLIPTFLSDNLTAARTAARRFLASYTAMPFYARMFRRSGFAAETAAFHQAMTRGNREGAAAQLSDRLIDEVCLVGPLSRCQENLAAFREAGVDYPILAAQAVDEAFPSSVRRVIQAFGGG